MTSIRVRTEGQLDEIYQKLKQLSEIDPNDISQTMGEILRTGTLDRFDSGKSPDGNAWPKSIRASGGGKTLVDSGRLRNSINVRSSASGVEVGTNTVYAAIHQFGGPISAKSASWLVFNVGGQTVRKKSVNIPARPYLGVSDEDEKEIKSMIDEVMES